MSVVKIAEKAGVSIATVSRVLNKSRPVNPEMAEAVHQAVRELQLPPHQAKRRSRPRRDSRKTSDTYVIASLGQSYRDWFQLPVIANVVAELARTAHEHDAHVLMAEMPNPAKISNILLRGDVTGAIVFVDSRLSTRDVAHLRNHLPVVRVMGAQLASVDVDHVTPDASAVGCVAAEYLLREGCRSLAFFTCQPDWDLSRMRAQGFLAAALAGGVRPRMLLQGEPHLAIDFYGPNASVSSELGELFRNLDGRDSGPLGLFVSRDEELAAVYRTLREVGLEPGKDVRIVSCDNETVRLSTLHPRPASIDLNASQIAQRAIRRLRERIEHPNEPPTRILISPRLVSPEEVDQNSDHAQASAAAG